MDIAKINMFWSEQLNIPLTQFRKPYIKSHDQARVFHKGRFAHGTCNVIVDGRDLSEYVLAGIKYLQQNFSRG